MFIRVSCESLSRQGRAPDTRLRYTSSSQDPWDLPLPQYCHSLTWSVSCSGGAGEGTPSSQSVLTCNLSEKMWHGRAQSTDPARAGLDLEDQALTSWCLYSS